MDLDKIIAQAAKLVEKKFKDVPAGLASTELVYPTGWLSWGSIALDRACRGHGFGGVPVAPQGRVIHLAGDYSTGKSVLLDHLFKSVQEMGGIGVCSETEQTRTPHFVQAIGINPDRLYIMRPPTLEQVIDMGILYHDAIREEDPEVPILWGIDSLDSSESEKTADKGLSESGGWHYGGGRSEALAAGLRKIVPRCGRYPTTLVMLNQTRDVIGAFGHQKRTPGGNPPHFYASLEVWLTIGPKGDVRGEYQGAELTAEQRKRFGMRATERGDVIGRWVRARVSKTKVSATLGQEADFYIDLRQGIHRWAGLLQRLLQEGIVDLGEKDKIIHTVGEGEKAEKHEFKDEGQWLTWLSKNVKVIE
jgi:RecA/RadA recombinase